MLMSTLYIGFATTKDKPKNRGIEIWLYVNLCVQNERNETIQSARQMKLDLILIAGKLTVFIQVLLKSRFQLRL